MTTKTNESRTQYYVDTSRKGMVSYVFGVSPEWRKRVIDDVINEALDNYDGDRPDLNEAMHRYFDLEIKSDETLLLDEHRLFDMALAFRTGYDYQGKNKS